MTARILMVLWTLTFFTVYAQSPPSDASLSGFVYDTNNGETLIGANVFLRDTKIGAVTNLRGYYVIPKIRPGVYTLVCQYIGYRVMTKTVTLSAGEEKVLRIDMQPEDIMGEEVVVYADSIPTMQKLFEKPISKVELSGQQINMIPQVVEADLLRSLQTLPGIVPVSDFSSALYIRGGTPDQNLYLIDGSDVYNPEHAFGLFSTFNTDAIKKVDLSKGGFGAEYGGRLSSVLNVTHMDGNRNEFAGTAGISILSAKTTLQAPIGSIGSLSGSFRRTYFDKTLGQAIDEIPDYYFYDGNVKAFFDIDGRNKLTISGYGGQDVLNYIFNENADNKAGFDYTWGNKTGSVRWTHVFSPQMFGDFWMTGSTFKSDFAFDEVTNYSEENFISDLTFKGSLEYHHSKQFITRFGFEQKNLHGVFLENFDGGKVDVNARRTHYVAYIQENWRPSDEWDIESGLRFDYFDSDRNFKNLDPRLALKYRLNESTNLKASAGVYHQYLHQIPRAFFSGIWTTSDRYQKGSTAYHFIGGVEREVLDFLTIELEGYYKKYKNIYSLNHFLITEVRPGHYENGLPVYDNTDGLFNRGDGHSDGLEILVKKEAGAVTGWLGYSLANTRYTIDGINGDHSFEPRHDRTHSVNAVANIDIRNSIRALKGKPAKYTNSKWLAGLNFVYASGQPITAPGSTYMIRTTPDDEAGFAVYPGGINEWRLPAYARLDVSVTYEKQFKHWSIAPYVQIFNIGNRKNVWFVQYDSKEQGGTIDQKVKTVNMFPLLPSFGVNFKF
ncbi:TonB-dependent receptor [bacterium]|nr:TonB-dependent receptor [bacterium]